MTLHVYKLSEVARILGVHVRTIEYWAASHRLPTVRIGPRCVRVTEEDLRAFVESGRQTATDADTDVAE